MGLSMTLGKQYNKMFVDFENAYWRIREIQYSTEEMMVILCCYPSRDSANQNEKPLTDKLDIGCGDFKFDSELYRWEGLFRIADVFPNGIPLGSDNQKTIIYNFIKNYTGLPFTDVFEEEPTVDEPLPQTEELG